MHPELYKQCSKYNWSATHLTCRQKNEKRQYATYHVKHDAMMLVNIEGKYGES